MTTFPVRSALSLLAILALMPLAVQADPGLKFVPPEAVAAVVMKPGDVWQSPYFQKEPASVFAAKWQQLLEFAPEEVDSVVAFVAMPAQRATPRFGLVAKTTQPVDLKSIRKKLHEFNTDVYGRQDYQWVTDPETELRYLKSDREAMPAIYPLDQHTLLVASLEWLPQLLQRANLPDKEAATGPLREVIDQGQGDADFQFYLTITPVREMARFLLSSPNLPTPWRQLHATPDRLRHLELYVRLTEDEPRATLILTGNDEADAARLEQTLDRLLTELADQLKESQDRPLAVMNLLAGLKPTRDGNRVTFAQRDASPDTTPSQVAQVAVDTGLETLLQQTKRLRSINQLKSLVLAMHHHHDAHNRFPPLVDSDSGKPKLSWRVQILPYMNEQELYQEFRHDEPWDSPHNLALVARMPAIFAPAAHPELASEGQTRFLRPIGEGMPGGIPAGARFQDITDGSSNTMFIVEAPAAKAVVWTKPEDLAVDLEDPLAALSDPGFLATGYDGYVHSIGPKINIEVLRAILTHEGKEFLGWDRIND